MAKAGGSCRSYEAMNMSSPAGTHGKTAQTSTTAPRYLSLRIKAEDVVEVVTVVAMKIWEEYKVQSWSTSERITKCAADQRLDFSCRPGSPTVILLLRRPSPPFEPMND